MTGIRCSPTALASRCAASKTSAFLTGRGALCRRHRAAAHAHGAVVMSPHAHCAHPQDRCDQPREKRRASICVLTGADAKSDEARRPAADLHAGRHGRAEGLSHAPAAARADRRAVSATASRFVVAETPEQARDAAELLKSITSRCRRSSRIEDAAKPGAPKVWDDYPRQRRLHADDGQRGSDRGGLRQGDAHGVGAAVQQPPRANAMEPRAAIGDYDRADDSYTLYTSSQNPHGVRSQLAASVFDLPETKLRVISPDVGGGFGMKGDAYPEDGLVLWASRRCGRPVKWVATRAESHRGRQPRPRPGRQRRAGAGRDGQDPRHARACAARGRLVHRVGGGRTAAVLAALHRRRLRRAGAVARRPRRCSRTPSPLGALSRRRPARGHLCDRAADRRGGASSSASTRSSCGGAISSRPAPCRTRRPTRRRSTTAATSHGSRTSA